MIWVLVMYALFGSIFAVGKVAMVASSPYFFTGIRMLAAGLILLAFLSRKGLHTLKIPLKMVPLLVLVAFFNVFITNAFEFWGLQYMDAGKTCLIYSLSPFAAALIAYGFNTEKMGRKKWLGLTIGLASFIPLMAAPWIADGFMHEKELLAEGALMVSAITAVMGWTFVKKLTIEQGLSHALVNGMSFVLAGVFSLLISICLERWSPLPVYNQGDFLWTLIYVVVIHNLICYSIYASSLQRFSVTFMAFIGLSNPFFAAFFGWAFLQEEISLSFVLAFLGVLGGLYLFYQEEKAPIREN